MNSNKDPTEIQDIKRQIEKIWGDDPKWFKRNIDSTKFIRTYKDKRKFTIILPCNPRALWWRDIMDRTIDTPIPVPGGKTTALAAFRIGNRKEGVLFRKKLLLKTKGKDLIEKRYTDSGADTPNGYQQDSRCWQSGIEIL